MLRRLLGLVVLLVVVAVAVLLWGGRTVGDLNLGASARELGNDVRQLGEEARDKLGGVGHKVEDATVAGAVKTALGLNRNLRPYSIEVSSEHGVVTLRGQVPGERLRSRAGAVAAEVPDVVRVLNQIQATAGGPAEPAGAGAPGENGVVDRIHVSQTTGAVAPAEAPRGAAGAERAAAAQRALRSNSNVAGFDLQVRQEGERLVLRGQVSTLAEKDLAGMLAREGAGVPLDNLVELRSGTP